MGCFCVDEKSLRAINDGHGWENWQGGAAGLHTGSSTPLGEVSIRTFVLW